MDVLLYHKSYEQWRILKAYAGSRIILTCWWNTLRINRWCNVSILCVLPAQLIEFGLRTTSGHKNMYLFIKVPARTTLQDATKALLTRLFLLAKAHGISGISGTVWWIQCISGRGLRMMSHVPPCRRATVPQHFSFHSALSRNLRGPCSSSACEFGWNRNSNQFRSTSSCDKLRQQVQIQVHLYVHYVSCMFNVGVHHWFSSLSRAG